MVGAGNQNFRKVNEALKSLQPSPRRKKKNSVSSTTSSSNWSQVSRMSLIERQDLIAQKARERREGGSYNSSNKSSAGGGQSDQLQKSPFERKFQRNLNRKPVVPANRKPLYANTKTRRSSSVPNVKEPISDSAKSTITIKGNFVRAARLAGPTSNATSMPETRRTSIRSTRRSSVRSTRSEGDADSRSPSPRSDDDDEDDNEDDEDQTRSPSHRSYNSRSPSQRSYNSRSPSQRSYNSRSPSHRSNNSRSPSQRSYNTRSPSTRSDEGSRSPSPRSNYSPSRMSESGGSRTPSPGSPSIRSTRSPSYRSTKASPATAANYSSRHSLGSKGSSPSRTSSASQESRPESTGSNMSFTRASYDQDGHSLGQSILAKVRKRSVISERDESNYGSHRTSRYGSGKSRGDSDEHQMTFTSYGNGAENNARNSAHSFYSTSSSAGKRPKSK